MSRKSGHRSAVWGLGKSEPTEMDDLQNPHVSFQQGLKGAQSEGGTFAKDLNKSRMWGVVYQYG